MGNVSSRVSVLLSEHFQLQQCVNGKWIVSIADFYCEEEGTNHFASNCRSESNGFHKARIIQEVPSSSSLELNLAAEQAYQKLLVRVKALWKIYDALFQEMLDVMKQSGEEITEGVEAVLWDPP